MSKLGGLRPQTSALSSVGPLCLSPPSSPLFSGEKPRRRGGEERREQQLIQSGDREREREAKLKRIKGDLTTSQGEGGLHSPPRRDLGGPEPGLHSPLFFYVRAELGKVSSSALYCINLAFLSFPFFFLSFSFCCHFQSTKSHKLGLEKNI